MSISHDQVGGPYVSISISRSKGPQLLSRMPAGAEGRLIRLPKLEFATSGDYTHSVEVL